MIVRIWREVVDAQGRARKIPGSERVVDIKRPGEDEDALPAPKRVHDRKKWAIRRSGKRPRTPWAYAPRPVRLPPVVTRKKV